MRAEAVTYRESGRCEISASLENVAQASAFLKSFCQRKGIDETLWPQIDLAFCECLNNAIEHGCAEDPAKTVYATWTWTGEKLVLEIEDPGAFVEAARASDLPEDPLCESGRGYFIIDSIAERHAREKTGYGQKLTVWIATHPETDPLERMEEMYQLLQSLTNDLNLAYGERDALEGFAADLVSCPVIESIIKKGINRLRGLIEIEQADAWTLEPGGALENNYHEGPRPLAIREAIVEQKTACACATVVATESAHFIERCSTLDPDDPLYHNSGCAIVCPILYQRDCVGVFALRCPDSEREVLLKRALPLAKTFAQFLGIAFTSAKTFRQREEQERAKTQLEIASEIQRSLLPSRFPANAHCRSIGRCETALAVGGDYIDAFEIRDAGMLIVIADVMGKGVPAALLATIFRTAIRSRLNLAETPGWLLSKINKQIHEELGHLSMFITAQAAYYDYGKRMLKLASAGHCPALLLRNSGSVVEPLVAEGMPLGIDPNDIYEERLIQLEEGSRIVFLTDGFYEAENIRGEMLGIERLANDLPKLWKGGLDALPGEAFAYISRFTQGRAAQDDQTLMALEIL